jgi:hypothetical protein
VASVHVDPITSRVYHIEARPSEKGRCVLVDTTTQKDLVEKDKNVRTGVHEYGGAAAIIRDGKAYYSNILNHRVYRVDLDGDGKSEPITPGELNFLSIVLLNFLCRKQSSSVRRL